MSIKEKKEKKTILVAMKFCPQLVCMDVILRQNNYNVVVASAVKAAMGVFDTGYPSLLLADIELPGPDSPAMIRNLRKTYEGPIIMLAQSYEERIIVNALDAGANDVLVLPFGRDEHLARIRAALRSGHSGKNGIPGGVFAVGGLMIDYARRLVTVDGRPVHLTPIEFRILTLLAKNAGNVWRHEEIINEIWGPFNSDNLVLRVNMANIRRKIEANPAEPRYIITDAGVGYRVAAE